MQYSAKRGQFHGHVILQASGSGSTLTLTGGSLAEPADGGSVLLIEALGGGTASMSTITSIIGGPVVLESNGSGSAIDLSGLTSFTSDGWRQCRQRRFDSVRHYCAWLPPMSGSTRAVAIGITAVTGPRRPDHRHECPHQHGCGRDDQRLLL